MRLLSKSGVILATTALVALAGSSSLAYGQDVKKKADVKNQDVPELEEIIVTGTRLQNKRAIGAKRRSVRVMDALAADEIGTLPDDNAGEALARLPGVSIESDQAEARFVSIRALNSNFNYTAIDGSTIAVPDRNGRRVFFDVLPSSLSKRIEIIKTFTPDIDGQAIGGYINFVSRSAFDYGDKTFFKLFGRIGQYDLNDGYMGGNKLSAVADFVLAHRFGADEVWGVVLTGNYYKRQSYSERVENGSYYRYYDKDLNKLSYGMNDETGKYELKDKDGKPTEVDNKNIVAMPSEQRRAWYFNNRTRYGTSIKFDYSSSEDLRADFKVFYHTGRDNERRNSMRIEGFKPKTRHSPTDFTVEQQRSRVLFGNFEFERSVWGTQFNGEKRFNDADVLAIKLSYSGSKFDNPESFVQYYQEDNLKYRLDFSRKVPILTPEDSDAYNDPDGYIDKKRTKLDFNHRTLDESVWEARLDWGHNAEGDIAGWGYKVGGKFRLIDRTFDQGGNDWYPAVTDKTKQFYISPKQFLSTGACPLNCAKGGGAAFFLFNGAKFDELFKKISGFDPKYQGNDGKSNDYWRHVDNKLGADISNDYSFDEKVKAAYGMVTNFGDHHRLIAGFRYERTDFKRLSYQVVKGKIVSVIGEGGYSNLLPSINFGYFVQEDLKIHTAYSRTLGRPGFGAVASLNTMSVINEDGGTSALTLGSPDLEPRISDNFDLSLEHYIDDGEGIISLGLFYKRIQGDFFKVKRDATGFPGVTTVSQLINLKEPINLFGLEFNIVKRLDFDFIPDFLQGFTLSFNATLLNVNAKYPNTVRKVTAKSKQKDKDRAAKYDKNKDGIHDIFPYREMDYLAGSANEIYNLSLTYDRGPLSARLAINHKGLQLQSVRTNEPKRDKYRAPRTKVDFQVGYKLSESLRLRFDIYNLTGSSRENLIGINHVRVQQTNDFGQAFFIGFTYKL